MEFSPPLVPARLKCRYKRFLFDALLDTGEEITGFCPNTGSMRGLTTAGSRIWLSRHDTAKRKYAHAFELIEADGVLVGVHAALANRLAREAIAAGLVSDLAHYETVRAEQRMGESSRIDFKLSSPGRPDCYVEVKNVHFIRHKGLAEFPDTVTARGARHLEDLAQVARQGARAVMLYVVQREDCDRLALCGDLDPAYVRAFRAALAAGVEAYAVKCRVQPDQIIPFSPIAMDEAIMPLI
ncbi:DNA/RNA nuclease SfsA [Rhizobium paknamense]|uniref:Sugar fermentation stimulation protein homolog n=1 Tax=Rhizobium paknamense TaxID=1206817 RepID=A0ABU0IHY9_9HYPH|nr:DNA/RNA nuclease SfsA [Rhizobium paknamense]MDQ0457238.1 sugar fermentation stimulation protein A [Rhizobium paknamense]